MNKYNLTMLAIMFTTGGFADIGATNGVANPATCDSGALDTDSGGAALEAEYTPETIDLNWYDNNGNIITTNSCVYDNGITLPSNPTRAGYTFKGWRVVHKYDFSTLDYSINTTWDATHSRWKPINGSDGYTMEIVFGTENSSDLSNGEWSDTFSYGTVFGNALCSTTSGTWATTGTPANDGGQYCWCRATGYQPSDSDVVYSPNSPLLWVFLNDAGATSNCASYCAYGCAYHVQNRSDFRRALFGQ